MQDVVNGVPRAFGLSVWLTYAARRPSRISAPLTSRMGATMTGSAGVSRRSRQHEVSHAKLLSAALGNNSVAACQYKFPYTDIASFISLAAGIENIGVWAYAGANQYITDPTYRSVTATILPVEARHQGFFQGPVMLSNDWTGPYDTPLGSGHGLHTSCAAHHLMPKLQRNAPRQGFQASP